MISFPNAKINLGLFITEKREDGFHNLETVFLPVGLCDILEFTLSQDGKDVFHQTGLYIEGKSEDNLVLKALHLMREEFDIPNLQIHLHKRIPTGAGLGGGSSDAAFMLRNLNEQFKLGLLQEKLMHMASKLGSDCSFFILNRPALAKGRGEILNTLYLPLEETKIIVVMPDIAISTHEAFSGVKPEKPSLQLTDILNKKPAFWQKDLSNDFEKTIFPKYPEINMIKEDLLSQGACYSSMSGSGSAVFGLFHEVPDQVKLSSGKIIYSGELNIKNADYW